jgi:hypothetical protein
MGDFYDMTGGGKGAKTAICDWSKVRNTPNSNQVALLLSSRWNR